MVTSLPDQQVRLREILRKENILGSFVGTFGLGLEMSQKTFDLILCNEVLPDGSGMELLEKIRAEHASVSGTVLLRTSNRKLPSIPSYIDAVAEPPHWQTLKSAIDIALAQREERCRRTSPRYDHTAIVEIAFPGFGTVHANIANISSGGMFIRLPTEAMPEIGTPCHFQVECPRTEVVFGGSGIVRWTRRMADEMALRGIGVQFSQVNETGLNSIINFLVQEIVSQSDPASS